MSTTIVMPQLGESVAEGVIGKWLKNEGDSIERDEPIVEVITDKVNAEIPSPVAGILQRIAQPEGATVAVGQEIAVIGDGAAESPAVSEEPSAVAVPAGADASAGSGESEPNGFGGKGYAAATGTATPPASSDAETDVSGGRGDRVRSSPLVRRLADQHGINLSSVHGTGIGGRVSKQDIVALIEQQGAPAAVDAPTFETDRASITETTPALVPQPRPSAPSTPRAPGAKDVIVPISPIRKIIADRMILSTTTIPHATTIVEVDITNVVRYRERKKDEFRRRENVALSYVAFVIKATVEALKEYPDVNSEWGGDHIVRKGDININVAVDAPDGLTTPVIHHADEKSLTGLSKSIYDLATRARSKKLRIEDMQGGTFTVNNTGALGSVWSMSIINPPQCGMLAAAAIVKRPVVVEQDGQDLIAVRSMMNLSFSFDHRLLDGGYAASFLSSVKDKLEKWAPEYPLY
jgi:2-oxoisovalerate dehydrogenase E2 component (dihydrolipoyl transacylase)